MARIDLIEGAGGGGAGWRARLAERVGRLRERLGETTPAVRWALAGQAALVLLLGALAVWQAVAPSQPYRTLAGVGEQLSGRHAQIRVVLADDVTEREVRALLERIQGHIVDGPSGVGAYTVEVPAPASAPDRLASVLETLRSHAGVRLAEPIRTR
jgi:hypothetical protein